jgi:SAM-dependent methyltransferase
MKHAQGTEMPPEGHSASGELAVVPEQRARPNIEWWKRHGGREWIEELERRRAAQDRYSKQEAWLAAHFGAAPSLRILDFGCGYGRHLRHLRHHPHLDLYGCDVSPNMVAVVGEHVDDVPWAREHVTLIEPAGRLPFDDYYFDVSYTSEVLIHVNPDDLPDVLRELVRVTFERLVLIENKRTDQTTFGSTAHAGCWLHDFVGDFARLGFTNIQVLDQVLADQDVYLIDLERGEGDVVGRRFRSSLAVRDGETRRLRQEMERMQSELAKGQERVQRFDRMVTDTLVRRIGAETSRRRAEAEVARLSHDVIRLEHSLARRAVERAKQFKRTYRLLRGVIDTVQSAWPARTGTPQFAPPEAAVVAELPFAGIAAAGFPATRESFIATAPPVVGICHPNWRGIRAATSTLCDGVLQIEEISSDSHAEAVARLLGEASTKTLVIQGIPPGSQRLAIILRRLLPKLRILNVYHGSTAQQTFPSESEPLDEMIDLARVGVLDGIGFVKVGVAECLRRIGIRAYPISNKIRLEPNPQATKPYTQGPMHIGVFVPNVLHKNINTQVMAALAIPESVVHLNELPALRLGGHMDRIKIHGLLPHSQFVPLLGEMDVNLYVTLSECFPMTVVESLERGVVCLTSDTSPIFDDDEFLRKSLVVTRLDDPWAIARKLEAAVANRVEIVARAQVHLERLNKKADDLWEQFVRG